MTVGPDGAFWFTERSESTNANIQRIGRMTLSGQVTEYAILTGSWFTSDIITGPDGALWFTGYSGAIGRITTSGKVTLYPTKSSIGVLGLTVGSDGAIWFTDGIDIDRVSTNGLLTATQGVYLGPSSITTGRDGALWGVYRNGTVQRIDTSRLDHRFSPPRYTTTTYDVHDLLFPGGITTGPDGALWFIGDAGIGRISITGTITEYRVTPDLMANGRTGIRSPSNIIVGPDRALWFVIPGQSHWPDHDVGHGHRILHTGNGRVRNHRRAGRRALGAADGQHDRPVRALLTAGS